MFNTNKRRAADQVRAKAAELLITDGALVELSAEDAREVVNYMSPLLVQAGEVVIQEGEVKSSDFMALVLDGEVTVESASAPTDDGMVVSVLGPGSLIGDLGLIDGGARSATCAASTDLALAVLTSAAMMRLITDKPAVAARLLMAMSKRIADHLRETNRKLFNFAQMSKALQQELDSAHAVNRRLMDRLSDIVSQAGGPAMLAGAAPVPVPPEAAAPKTDPPAADPSGS